MSLASLGFKLDKNVVCQAPAGSGVELGWRVVQVDTEEVCLHEPSDMNPGAINQVLAMKLDVAITFRKPEAWESTLRNHEDGGFYCPRCRVAGDGNSEVYEQKDARLAVFDVTKFGNNYRVRQPNGSFYLAKVLQTESRGIEKGFAKGGECVNGCNGCKHANFTLRKHFGKNLQPVGPHATVGEPIPGTDPVVNYTVDTAAAHNFSLAEFIKARQAAQVLHDQYVQPLVDARQHVSKLKEQYFDKDTTGFPKYFDDNYIQYLDDAVEKANGIKEELFKAGGCSECKGKWNLNNNTEIVTVQYEDFGQAVDIYGHPLGPKVANGGGEDYSNKPEHIRNAKQNQRVQFLEMER